MLFPERSLDRQIAFGRSWDPLRVSKMCRNGSRFGDLEAGGPTMVSPWSLHGISMESPWNLHRISMESPSNLHGGNIDSAATRTPTYILDA